MPLRTPTLEWIGDEFGHVDAIEQTLLPLELVIVRIDNVQSMWDAIKRLAIRGAPAIGVAAGYGMVLAMQPHVEESADAFARAFREAKAYLAGSRPTAVNLFWALDRMDRFRGGIAHLAPAAQLRALFEEAERIAAEDRDMCEALGRHGQTLVQEGDVLLTHCNAGALATAGSGTALSVMFAAKDAQKKFSVYVDETRPLLQGSRLTAWELMQAGIDATLICDNMAAHVMKTKKVSRVFVGADRIARNGDAANKIGTYGVAVLARFHGVPFYVVAPTSTFDLSIPDGSHIPIEERDPKEICEAFGKRTAPEGVQTFSPAFDVTPASLLAGIVTERGIIHPVTESAVVAMVRGH